jgi:Sporulation and spore germination
MRRRHSTGSPGRRRARATAAGVALALALTSAAGCGVAAQREPEAVLPGGPAAAAPAPPQVTGVVQVYLVRDGHLVPVPRTGRSTADALGALTAGPTALDIDAGLRSSLPALPVDIIAGQDHNTITIAVPAEFEALSARDQLLAAGQLIWTATELCCATHVRVLLDDHPLPVPTDRGPTTRPLRRADYRSVAPL